LEDCRSRVTLYCSVTVDGAQDGARGGEGALAPSYRVPQGHSCHDHTRRIFPTVLLFSTRDGLRHTSHPLTPLYTGRTANPGILPMNILLSCDNVHLVATCVLLEFTLAGGKKKRNTLQYGSFGKVFSTPTPEKNVGEFEFCSRNLKKNKKRRVAALQSGQKSDCDNYVAVTLPLSSSFSSSPAAAGAKTPAEGCLGTLVPSPGISAGLNTECHLVRGGWRRSPL